MLLGDETVGPISDIDFLQLIQRGEIDRDTVVRSVQFTSNNEVAAGKLNLQLIRELQLQRFAEEQRVASYYVAVIPYSAIQATTDSKNVKNIAMTDNPKQANLLFIDAP